jgi:hypothetical protein
MQLKIIIIRRTWYLSGALIFPSWMLVFASHQNTQVSFANRNHERHAATVWIFENGFVIMSSYALVFQYRLTELSVVGAF